MSEQTEQARLGNYGITVFYEDGVTFFSVTEESDPNRTRMLMWKHGVGFETRVVIRDARSDLEFTKPLEASEFPDGELLRLLGEHPESLSAQVSAQIVAILRQRHRSDG